MPEFSESNQPPNGTKSKGVAKGNKRRRLVSDAIMVALKREATCIVDGKPTKQLNNLATKLVEKAVEGDIQAIREVLDRTEGKAMQAIELSGEQGGALIVQFNSEDAGLL